MNDDFKQLMIDEIATRRDEDRSQNNRPPRQALDRTPYGYEQEIVTPGAGKKVPPLKRHKQRSTVDVYRHYFREDELAALARFVADAEAATIVNVTSSYDGIPGGGGRRDGGVAERHRLAHSRFTWVARQIERTSPHSMALLRELVLSVRNERMNRALTIHEVAKSHAPHLQKKEALGAFGAGLLKSTAWWLVGLYEQYGQATKPIDQDNAVRQGRRQREAQR